VSNKCRGRDCIDKERCDRYLSEPEEFQWWDEYDRYRGETCDWFFPTKTEITKSLWTLYVVRCADQTLYCGIAKDVANRLKAHNAGRGAKYVRGRLPVVLVATWGYPDRSSVSKAEYAFKKLTRSEKLFCINHPNEWNRRNNEARFRHKHRA